MAKIESATFDTGPWMHLFETQQLAATNITNKKIAPPEVITELADHKIPTIGLKETNLNANSKDLAKLITERYELHLGKAQAIALTIQEKTRCLFTDDLDARTIAKTLSLNVHGTLAVITRALREKILTKKEAKEAIQNLHTQSTLFLTSDLVSWALKEIDNYSL